ncbi:aminoalkylphosphonic acid N-acetyltransferase [Oceanobacillus picturae]|uniref:Aminoalkylphosphonic acid N-acetyltransferase n=1 Tax=Oceanobacillus picturae TaxID=171693 RepID=A0A0U9H7M4_9BACI|nr:GNAT family N-acetyltransferase [Oceanobacillus picturae]GAQ17281.1 aminoalkylphosphonic acid N-acetyltransferase [Oceanobacillus picturae]
MNTTVRFRIAMEEDVSEIVQMLADDELGNKRERYEQPLPSCYLEAFQAIDQDHNNELVVAVKSEKVIGVLQLTYIPYLTYKGGWRALIESVRVHSSARGSGIGEQLMTWAIQRAKEKGCHVVQLTTDKQRPDALRFYKKLGFVDSHEGMKYHF